MAARLRDPRLGMPWLAVRLWAGWSLLEHGWVDSQGGGAGAFAGGTAELVFGLALVVGLFTPVAAAGGVLVGALGLPDDAALLAVCALLLAAGPGAVVYGADRFLRKTRRRRATRSDSAGGDAREDFADRRNREE